MRNEIKVGSARICHLTQTAESEKPSASGLGIALNCLAISE